MDFNIGSESLKNVIKLVLNMQLTQNTVEAVSKSIAFLRRV